MEGRTAAQEALSSPPNPAPANHMYDILTKSRPEYEI